MIYLLGQALLVLLALAARRTLHARAWRRMTREQIERAEDREFIAILKGTRNESAIPDLPARVAGPEPVRRHRPGSRQGPASRTHQARSRVPAYQPRHAMSAPERDQVIAGMRKVVDALEVNPILRLPWAGSASPLSIYCRSREEMRSWVSLLEGTVTEGVDPTNQEWYRIRGRIGGLSVVLSAGVANLEGKAITRTVQTFEVERFLPALASVAD